jgi:hypothetical protein
VLRDARSSFLRREIEILIGRIGGAKIVRGTVGSEEKATKAVRTGNGLRRPQSPVIGQEFFARFDVLVQEVANPHFVEIRSITLGEDSVVRRPKQDFQR